MKRWALIGLLSTGLATVLLFVSAIALASSLSRGAFIDDDDNVHEGSINAIAAEQIAKGCNPPINSRYCPHDPVTRGQMAAFLRRAFHLPSSSVDSFVDDEDSVFEVDINAVAAAGITQGCNPPANDRFCPEERVNRGQMAAFLRRAFDYPTTDLDYFDDDKASIFESDINAIATAGVTKGCNPPMNDRYCPTALVKRDQMASFFARSLDLPPESRSVTITIAGDMGANAHASATLVAVADIVPDAHFVAGDLSYSQVVPESAWCSYVRDVVGTSITIELLVGTHEDDNGSDGFIRDFAACMPDQLTSTGDYGVQYYSDLGDLVRVVLIAPDISVDGVHYDYRPGSSERAWLEKTVADAKSRGLWIVLVQHKVCISSAEKSCEITEELANWEASNADLVVMGHAHNYQRSHQLSCVDAESVNQACIADTDGNHSQGEGAVFVIAGMGGRHRPVDRTDTEADYFAALMGEGDQDWGHGLVRIDISEGVLTGTFVGGDTTYTDTFTLHR